MAVVALIGTFDTKGPECSWVCSRIEALGVKVLAIDVGPFSTANVDVSAAEVAAAAGEDLEELKTHEDRG